MDQKPWHVAEGCDMMMATLEKSVTTDVDEAYLTAKYYLS